MLASVWAARFLGISTQVVIADTMVDREFGTGCVKITPAHDNNDFKAGRVAFFFVKGP